MGFSDKIINHLTRNVVAGEQLTAQEETGEVGFGGIEDDRLDIPRDARLLNEV